MNEPNKVVYYVDYKTGERVDEDFFFDPFLAWDWQKTEQGWGWQLVQGYGGRVLETWLDANPRPTWPPSRSR